MIFRGATSNYKCSRLDYTHSHLVDLPNVPNDVQNQIVFIRVGEEHVTDCSIRNRRTESWNIIFVAPVIYSVRTVNLLAESGNHFARCP
jgi:hypothetical protein